MAVPAVRPAGRGYRLHETCSFRTDFTSGMCIAFLKIQAAANRGVA